MSSSARYLSLKEAAALAEVPEDTILFWKKESLLKFIEESSEVLFCKRLLLRRLEQKEYLPLPGASKPVSKVKKEKVQKKKVSAPKKKKVERKVVERKKVARVLPPKKEKIKEPKPIAKVEKKPEQITLFEVPPPSPPIKKGKSYISMKEAAELAGVSVSTIREWRIGFSWHREIIGDPLSKIRIDEESFLKYLEQNPRKKRLKKRKPSPDEYSIQPLFEDEGFCKALSTLTPLAKDLEWKKNSGWFWSTCGRFVICPGPGKGEEGTAELWSQSGNKRGTLLSTWAHLRNAKIWAKRLSVQRQWR